MGNVTIVNPRRACAARVTVIGSVCVSVKSHLTYGSDVSYGQILKYFSTLIWSTKAAH